MQVKTDTEVQHMVTDATTNEVVPFVIQCDNHGMTVELSDGQIVTLDLSGGTVNIYHNKNSDDTGENVHQICLGSAQEQQPPKVVRVRNKETGVTCDAVRSFNGCFWVPLTIDGLACYTSPLDDWEEIKSDD